MSDQRYLVFRINEVGFSIPIDYVNKVIDTLQTRSFPLLKPEIEGLFAFENKLIPMIKLQEAMGIVSSNVFYSNVEESIIIGKYQNYYFSFRVDSVEGIVTVNSDALIAVRDNPEATTEISAEYSVYFFFDGLTNIYIVDIGSYLNHTLKD